MMTEDEVLARLRADVEATGGPKAWGLAHGFSIQYVSDVLNRRRSIGPRVLAALGLEAQIVYKPKEPQP